MHGPFITVDAAVRRGALGVRPPTRQQIRELGRRARRAAQRMGIDAEAREELAIRICDDKAIAALKEEFFGVRQATDVLSFPADDGEGDGADGRGDIALSWPTCFRQARAHRVDVLREATILIVHGMAHLLGHDHHERDPGFQMHLLEKRGLRAVRVPDLRRSYGVHPLRGVR